MLSIKGSYLCIYEFLLDILIFTLLTILCVHISLWMYVIMSVVHLEIYTHKRSYISTWYLICLESTLFIFYSLVTPKRICPMSACLIFFSVFCTHLLFFLSLMLALVSMLIPMFGWVVAYVSFFIWYLLFVLNHIFYSKCLASLLFYDLLLLFCVLRDIWWVTIPYLCTLYSNAKNSK